MDRHGEDAGRHELRAGHVVSRPAGEPRLARVPAAATTGMTLLAYGHRDPADICFYPRSQKLNVRGAGVIFRVETLDYWDGEL